MTRLKVVGFSFVAVLLAATTTQLTAAQISSLQFSLGYGRSGQGSQFPPDPNDPNGLTAWSEAEANNDPNNPLNTPTTQGDFTFTPTLSHTSSGNFSGGGPTFVDRVLGNGVGTEYVAKGSNFTVDVDGAYTGPLTVISTQTEITQISVWGVDGRVSTNSGPMRTPEDETGPWRWNESTPGNAGVSPFFNSPTCASIAPDCNNTSAIPPGFGVLGAAGHYVQVIWDPGDPNFTPGATPATRTFNYELGSDAEATDSGVDGFEIIGFVHVKVANTCDFDGGGCGLSDINLMFQQGDLTAGVAVSAGNQFDLDSDNDIDENDITQWLILTGATNGYSSPMLRGDTDDLDNTSPTDRTVDITDFQNFLIGFTGAGIDWEVGNFNGDSVVDITDFSIHFLPSFAATAGGTYGPSQSIPEPSTVLLLGIAGVLLAYMYWPSR